MKFTRRRMASDVPKEPEIVQMSHTRLFAAVTNKVCEWDMTTLRGRAIDTMQTQLLRSASIGHKYAVVNKVDDTFIAGGLESPEQAAEVIKQYAHPEAEYVIVELIKT